MTGRYWRSQPAFGHLGDELAQDRVVFFTGAGISRELQTHDKGRPLPSWLELLRRLAADADVSADDRRDLECLLDDELESPESAHFLEAASILSKAIGTRFQATIAAETREIATSTSLTHRQIFLV
jgi:hypothetical protein